MNLLKDATLQVVARIGDEVVATAEYSGLYAEKGKKFEFVAPNNNGTKFRLSATSRKMRKTPAEKMTNILRVKVQECVDGGASVAEAAQLAGVDSYFDDLAAMGGNDAWLFEVAYVRATKTYYAFAFCCDSRTKEGNGGTSGAGYVLLPGASLARYSSNIEYKLTG